MRGAGARRAPAPASSDVEGTTRPRAAAAETWSVPPPASRAAAFVGQRHHDLLERVGVDPRARQHLGHAGAQPDAREAPCGARAAAARAPASRARSAGSPGPRAPRTSRAGAHDPLAASDLVRIRSRNWRASRRASRLPLAASEASASAQPAMPASGFEISCATPGHELAEEGQAVVRDQPASRSARCSVMSSNIESTWLVRPPRRTGSRRTWYRPPVGLDDLLVRAARLRSTRRSTGSVASKPPLPSTARSGLPDGPRPGRPSGPCSRTRFQATTRRLRSTT